MKELDRKADTVNETVVANSDDIVKLKTENEELKGRLAALEARFADASARRARFDRRSLPRLLASRRSRGRLVKAGEASGTDWKFRKVAKITHLPLGT